MYNVADALDYISVYLERQGAQTAAAKVRKNRDKINAKTEELLSEKYDYKDYRETIKKFKDIVEKEDDEE